MAFSQMLLHYDKGYIDSVLKSLSLFARDTKDGADLTYILNEG
jgi:hypothetical protein